ncbi:hypothetical protein QRX50_35550 [Amycolatopsis carbonis]|uniref:Uncharacterized protein n=1 Tax=Amycolatopsis carbonis TaxID=715471 RepID=A0A9Y2IBL0_9PSEU|nr:hypothetical protein [Amycolatopsis sp. 2-15]WIX76727.1 hypothetical protein QRX50_35550 [Amycolatopsis sp. 2-15]
MFVSSLHAGVAVKRSFPALGGIARQLGPPHILANQLGHNIPADEE